MPDIQLQSYTAKIRELIRSGYHDQAIAHCQHVLHIYPKHVATYCLLGEACFEQQMDQDAIDCFQRTLSADPENLIARVGLGLVFAGQGTLPEAIWQMERAFELAPGNTEVRRELQRLYALRDGVEKPHLRLTPGALARLYARNALYERAIGEFRAVLLDDPNLPDVRVALAEALWHEGLRLEAVETSLELLAQLPNCLKANLILGEIWLCGGNEEAAEDKLAVAQALDPEFLVAYQMMGRDSPIPLQQVVIPELELVPPPAAAGPARAFLPVEWDEPAIEGAAPGEALDLSAEETPEGLAMPGEDPLAESIAGGVEAGGLSEASGVGAAAASENPDWLRDLEPDIAAHVPEGDTAADQVPPSMRALVQAGILDDADVEAAMAQMTPEEIQQQRDEEVPDWLQALLSERAAASGEPGAVVATALAAEEIPDWLRDLDLPVIGEGPAAPPAAASGAAAARAGLPAEVEPAVPVAQEEIPDWLRDLDLPAVEEVPGSIPAVEEKVPEATGVSADVDETAPATVEEIPDWLRQLELPAVEEVPAVDEAGEAGEIAEPGGPAAEAVEAATDDEIPEWLRDLQLPSVEEVPAAGQVEEAVEISLLDATPALSPHDELVARLKAGSRNPKIQLDLARLYRDEGDWANALQSYEELVARRKLVPIVIGDLESLLGTGADQARLCRLLGDAYSQANRPDDASAMYQQARQGPAQT
jgi:tetratricopeptide (TPR) repeat protein